METIEFSKRDLRLKSWLGLPTWVITIFAALVLGGNHWWLYLGVLLFGWYLYTLLYWKLYQRLMLNQKPKKKGVFYGSLLGYQVALFAAVVAFLVRT